MRTVTAFAKHVVARTAAPEVTVHPLSKFLSDERDSATGIEEEIAGLALHRDIHGPERLVKALKLDDLLGRERCSEYE